MKIYIQRIICLILCASSVALGSADQGSKLYEKTIRTVLNDSLKVQPLHALVLGYLGNFEYLSVREQFLDGLPNAYIHALISGYLADSEYLLLSPHAQTIANLLPGEPIILPDSIAHARAISKKNAKIKELLDTNTFNRLKNFIPGLPEEALPATEFIGHTGSILLPAKTLNPTTKQFELTKAAIIAAEQFCQNEKYYFTTAGDKTARIWNIEAETSFILYGHTSPIVKARFTPPAFYRAESAIVTGDEEGTIIYWNFKTNEMVVGHGHKTAITEIIFHVTDGIRMLQTTSQDGQKLIWLVDEQNTDIDGMDDTFQRTVKYSYSTDALKTPALPAPATIKKDSPQAPAPSPQEDREIKAMRQMINHLKQKLIRLTDNIAPLMLNAKKEEVNLRNANKRLESQYLQGNIHYTDVIKLKQAHQSELQSFVDYGYPESLKTHMPIPILRELISDYLNSNGSLGKLFKVNINLQMDIEDLEIKKAIRNYQLKVEEINASNLSPDTKLTVLDQNKKAHIITIEKMRKQQFKKLRTLRDTYQDLVLVKK